MTTPDKGILLIANPFLKDPNFLRTVVLICNHEEEEGSFGLTLNKKLPLTLADVLPEITDSKLPIYLGGPVQPDTLHFVHQYPDLITGGAKLCENTFWGGNFESLQIHLKNGSIAPEKIKFFLGYSGWSADQLEAEMLEDSWLTVSSTPALIFRTEPDDVWRDSVKELGGEYENMIHYPLDPQLN